MQIKITLNIFTVTAEIENGTDTYTTITDASNQKPEDCVTPETGTEVVATAAPTGITAPDTMSPEILPVGKETEYNVCLSM